VDKKLLIELLQDGMQVPTGRHRFWVSRCFEISVRPDKKVVELDEYESFSTEKDPRSRKRGRRSAAAGCKEMFHIGKSVIHLTDGRVVEELGEGWKEEAAAPAGVHPKFVRCHPNLP